MDVGVDRARTSRFKLLASDYFKWKSVQEKSKPSHTSIVNGLQNVDLLTFVKSEIYQWSKKDRWSVKNIRKMRKTDKIQVQFIEKTVRKKLSCFKKAYISDDLLVILYKDLNSCAPVFVSIRFYSIPKLPIWRKSFSPNVWSEIQSFHRWQICIITATVCKAIKNSYCQSMRLN